MYIGDSTSITSDLSEEPSEDKESDIQCDESFNDRDTKSKLSDESSAEQSIKVKEYDDCCLEKSGTSKPLDESYVEELDFESNFKSVGYRNENYVSMEKTFQKINFEEQLETRLPENLRLLVQKHLDELKVKNREES